MDTLLYDDNYQVTMENLSRYKQIDGINSLGKNKLLDIEMAIHDPTIMDEKIRHMHNIHPCPNRVA